MELRTELLAVSCVGDFISCQPRSLLKFNFSHIVHNTEKNAILLSLGDYMFEIAKAISFYYQKILRILIKTIITSFINLSFRLTVYPYCCCCLHRQLSWMLASWKVTKQDSAILSTLLLS